MTMMCRPAGARAACAAPSRRATSHPPHLLCCFAPHPPPLPAWPQEEAGLPVQDRLYRSLKLWSFYVDLEERLVGAGECGVGLQRTANNAPCARPARPPLQACAVHPSGAPLPLNTLPLTPPPPSSLRSLGTLESTKAVYESILDLRIATPQIVLNYATFMTENKFFEEAFRWVCCAPLQGRARGRGACTAARGRGMRWAGTGAEGWRLPQRTCTCTGTLPLHAPS